MFDVKTTNPNNAVGAVRVGEAVVGRGRGNSRILILPITKMFDKKYACNLVCRLELAIPCLFCQKFRENCMFPHFLPILCVYFQYVQNFEVALKL